MSTMNAKLFSDHVSVLVKPPLDIIQSLSPTKVDLWHGATGLILELVELFAAIVVHEDQENVDEELGDIMFYLEQIEQRLARMGIFTPPRTSIHSSPNMLNFLVCGGDLCDLIKKYVVYDKDLSSAVDVVVLSYALARALSDFKEMLILFITENSERTPDEIRHLNYLKLKKRYPAGYTDKAASDRADKAYTNPQNQVE